MQLIQTFHELLVKSVPFSLKSGSRREFWHLAGKQLRRRFQNPAPRLGWRGEMQGRHRGHQNNSQNSEHWETLGRSGRGKGKTEKGERKSFPHKTAQNSLSWWLLLEFLFMLTLGLPISQLGMIPLI